MFFNVRIGRDAERLRMTPGCLYSQASYTMLTTFESRGNVGGFEPYDVGGIVNIKAKLLLQEKLK